MELIEVVKNSDTFNELFYVLCRSSYLQNPKRGYIHIITHDIKGYIDYIKGEGVCPKITLSYIPDDNIGYTPINQFAVKVNSYDVCIVDKIVKRNTYFSKKDPSDMDICLPCVICKQSTFVEIDDYGESKIDCVCCSKKCNILCVYECIKCTAQYVHLSDE